MPGRPGPDGKVVAGDGNGDGRPDSEQPEVVSSPVATASGQQVFVTLVAANPGSTGSTPGAVVPIITEFKQTAPPPNLPPDVNFPLGQFVFAAKVAEPAKPVPFTFYVDASLNVNGYWKLNASGVYVNVASSALGGSLVREGDRVRVDFLIVDGGEFDSDGKADGVISDPGALGSMTLTIVGNLPDARLADGFWF